MLDLLTENSRASCCGKTFQVYYPPRTTHSDTFWLDWLKNVSRYNQHGVDGQTLVMCIRPELSRGESSMLNTSDLPNDAKECLLWQALDSVVSPKYSLSAKACAGILRRARQRGKVLPPTLREALEHIANPYWGGVVKASGGALGGGSETIVVHGTQDPITSKNIAHCLGGNLEQENVPCFVLNDQGGQSLHVEQDCISPTLRSEAHGNLPIIMTPYIIRKLTPVECERLMGFPGDYTCIPWHNKSTQDCPDSPRYKAIGNSMAVPVIKWIGERMINYLNK